MSQEDLFNELLVELECPVCTNHMQPPIRQCKGGHSICTECSSKLTKCPTCNIDLKNNSRNFTLEKLAAKLARFPCHNRERGCIFYAFEVVALSQHEISCHFNVLQCPLANEEECEWRGIAKDMPDHCLEKHKERTKTLSQLNLTFADFRTPTSNTIYYSYLFHVYDQLFKYACNFNSATGFFGWCIWHLSTNTNISEGIGKYRFKITIFEKEDYGGQTMFLGGPCPSFSEIPEKDQEKYFVGNNMAYLKNFCKSSKMYVKVFIIKPNEEE